MRAPLRPSSALVPVSLLGLALAGCGGGGSSGSDLTVRTTTQAASPAAPIVVSGDTIVYLASETFQGPAGTDGNGDGDTNDQVAFVVDARARTETPLAVAAQAATAVGSQVYLQVDESADGRDWSGDMVQDDFVLLHWSKTTAMLAFVDEIADGARLVAAGDKLYYESVGAPLGVSNETTLRSLSATAPTMPTALTGLSFGSMVASSLRPLAQRAGLLFCAADENVDGLDYNQDGDGTDTAVLVLLDPADPNGLLVNTMLALAGDDEPLAARATGTSDWLVAFLVDEAAQGGTNLNDQALFSQPLLPENCAGTPDTDALDRVLHYLDYSDALMGALPVNTGLAGHDRVLILDGFVATLSNEVDANCNLNAATGDADMNDDVVRWVATTLPVAPARDAEDLHAIAIGTGGGSMGVAVLNDRIIGVIDEAADSADFDTQTGEMEADHNLVAWLDPEASNPTWRFQHQSAGSRQFGTGVFDSTGKSEPFAGTNWMAPETVNGRLPLVFLENVPSGTNPNLGSLNTNLDCNLVNKDTDETDGLPVWADFESGPTLDFDGVGYAVDLANPGIQLASGFVFFRVSEAADNRDYNNDGQLNDVVLFRNPLTTCGPVPMATSSLVAGLAITTDGVSSAAFLSSESQAGLDFNGDGDLGDLVVRYFRF